PRRVAAGDGLQGPLRAPLHLRRAGRSHVDVRTRPAALAPLGPARLRDLRRRTPRVLLVPVGQALRGRSAATVVHQHRRGVTEAVRPDSLFPDTACFGPLLVEETPNRRARYIRGLL